MMHPVICWGCSSYCGTRVYHVHLSLSDRIVPICGKCKQDWARGYHIVRVERVK
jgi:hypothetical protein